MGPIQAATKSESSVLFKEYATYSANKPFLLKYFNGKWAVISGSSILDIAEDYKEALEIGYGVCGLDRPFIVHQILEKEKVISI